MKNTIYLFKDRATLKWAFRWNEFHFWTSMSVKEPVDIVKKFVAHANPKYPIVVVE